MTHYDNLGVMRHYVLRGEVKLTHFDHLGVMRQYVLRGMVKLTHFDHLGVVRQYVLRGMVVHSGQASGGHYYSYIRLVFNFT